MNKKNLFVIVVLMLMAISLPALPQDNTVFLGNKPVNIYFNESNFLVVHVENTPKPLIFGYKGKGFPIGTQTRYKQMTVNNEKQVSIEYMVPGDTWKPLTWDMLKCKDQNGKDCQAPTVTPVPPAPQKCHWYYQWPCMSKEEKVAFVTLGIVGGVAIAVCSPHGGTGASKKKAGDGGGCRLFN